MDTSLTAHAMSTVSYPDFVGLTGQENTPPGGRRTVLRWIDRSTVTTSSVVLDLACSTGFSGREVHVDTGARVWGIDLCETAIATARTRAVGNPNLRYAVADAAELPFADATFSHVLAGSNFGFIAQRESALAEASRVLKPGGALCVSAFFYRSIPSDALLDDVEEAIGFRPDARRDHTFWSSFFSARFTLEHETIRTLRPRGTWRTRRSVRKAINGVPLPDDARLAARRRLLTIRQTLEQHRAHQGLSIAIWRRRAD